MLKKQAFCAVTKIIEALTDDYEAGDEFCLYGKTSGELKEDGEYWLDDYPDVSDDGDEIYPDAVVKLSLSYVYSGRQFADVVQNVLGQKKSPSTKDFVAALDFYSKNDTFLDF